MRSHKKIFYSKVFKILSKFKIVFNFKKFPICFRKSFIQTLHVPIVIYS